ncbi:dephospho-CoA kinase [Bacillus ectoiniformans]|uniref:dephospho-CoA kinase n=1 Tax=Bacillus ectoiniformans TaxID=1494429 RepID=UPI00195C3C11|nr:dephospho-CoA kinase [Bacillus ectoiniformans]MBM7648854.1 dephospho-CoA kinase [Bacillus ectoiniformans]
MAAIIGLTGGIASGKSTVSALLAERGYVIVDADVAARAAVEPGTPALQKIVEEFGQEVLLGDGSLDRGKLGEIIFHQEDKRKVLNGIVHPAVRTFMLEAKDTAIESGHQTVIMDIPLLFESDLLWMVEKVIVVFIDEETQLQRLMNRNALDERAAKARIASQMALIEKAKRADWVIDNNGSIEETERQLSQLIDNWKLVP